MKRLIVAALLLCLSCTKTGDKETGDAVRAHELAALLDEKPAGFGKPVTDRETWNALASEPGFAEVVTNAERLMNEPPPALPEDLFLEYSRNGNRSHYQAPFGRRRSTLSALVIAECIENRGRFIPAIGTYIDSICTEKTWVYPAHDGDLDNFYGRRIYIDLAVATTSWNLATADYLLGDNLPGDVRQLIRKEVRRRAFDSFLAMIRGEEELRWWMTEQTNNWNSVCIGGVAGAALALIDSPEERGWFLLGVERYAPHYLLSFTEDGYCSEGLGYWNYGFGHYIMLAEAVRQATGGQWDMLDNPKVERIARYPLNIEIVDGVYPAFADCRVDASPSGRYMRFLNRRYGFGIDTWESLSPSPRGMLYEFALFDLSDPYAEKITSDTTPPAKTLRHWFENAGILVARPEGDPAGKLAVALKGGHNNEHHNHNDVGSYLAVLDGKSLLIDPGGEVYTKRTFSSRRYESDVLNSYGHPVPVIAGKLQKTGAEAKAVVLETEFSDSRDRYVIDMTAAYDVPELESLVREFVYSREGRGSLTVTDRMQFSSPQTYETALVTFSDIREIPGGTFIVSEDGTSFRVEVDTGGLDYTVDRVTIEEDLPGGTLPTRTGLSLREPVSNAVVSLYITPR